MYVCVHRIGDWEVLWSPAQGRQPVAMLLVMSLSIIAESGWGWLSVFRGDIYPLNMGIYPVCLARSRTHGAVFCILLG